MSLDAGTGHALLLQAGEALRRMGLDWEVLEHGPAEEVERPDAVVRLRYPGGTLDMAAEIKLRPRRERLASLLEERRRGFLRRLLVADYINPKLAEWLRDREVMFLDAAGNAHLRNEGLWVWVVGRRDRLHLQAEREPRRAFQPSGLKVVFVLLSRPGSVEAGYCTLARMAGVALGTVQRVIRELIEEGYVLRPGRRRRRLVEAKALLGRAGPGCSPSPRPGRGSARPARGSARGCRS